MTTIQNDPQAKEDLHRNVGAMLQPLFTWRGKAIYPVFGASQPAGESDSEPKTDEEEDKETPEASGGDTVDRADFEKLRSQLSAADKRRTEAETKLKELDDAKKDELTKATERAEQLEKVTQAQDKEIADLRLQNAFLTADTGIEWHDPGDALALAERKGYLDGVVVEGKVDSKTLATKLKELAKASPHLVKTDTKEEPKKPPVRTGAPVGGKPNGGKDEGPDLSRYSRLLNR